MDRLLHKVKNSQLRTARVRSKIHGSKDKPRLSVHISLKHVIAQLIDDDSHTTLVYVSSIDSKNVTTMTDKAVKVGQTLAKNAQKIGIKHVVMDRGGKLYHGRIKALADAAREQGLEF
jgi:large subunit ribosomal protein L18